VKAKSVSCWLGAVTPPPELCVFEREEALVSAGIDKRRYSSYAIMIQLCFALFRSVEGS